MNTNVTLETFVKLIEGILELPDEALTDEVIELTKKEIQSNYELSKGEVLRATRQDFRGKTRMEREALLEDVKNAGQEIIDSVELDPNSGKAKLIQSIFSTFHDIAAEAMLGDTTIYFELVHPNAKIPTYAHSSDVGADIYLPEDIVIPAQARGFMIKTGLKMAMENGWLMDVRPRSGLSYKTDLRISNTPGTIDAGYRGEVGILVDNLSDGPITLRAGDRIAQFVLHPVYQFSAELSDNVESIGENRNGGFGSTGK